MKKLFIIFCLMAGFSGLYKTYGQSATLSGSVVPSINESGIRAGGATLIITISGDTIIDSGSFDALRQDIIDGMSGDQNWSDLIAIMSPSDVVRTNDSVVRITFPANSDYYINTNETVSLSFPGSALKNSGTPIVATPTFTILNEGVSLSISGSLVQAPKEDEWDIRNNSGETLILTLTGDRWVQTIDNNNGIADILLSNITGSPSWNTEVMEPLNSGDITLSNQYTLQISFKPAPSYDIGSEDFINIEILHTILRSTNSGSVVQNSAFSILPSPPSATLSDPGLIEYTLDGSTVTINLQDETFLNSSLIPSNFTASRPGLITVSSATHNNSTSATLQLSYSGDFDTNITDFSITVSASELTGSSNLTSGAITIIASLEPEITSAVINPGTYKIGDQVRVNISVVSNSGNYTLVSGNVAGKNLQSISKQNNSLYYGFFTVAEGDDEYGATDAILVNNIRLDNSPLIGEVYSGTTSGAVIDTHYPVVNSMTVTGNQKKVGDIVDIFVQADGNNYTAEGISSVNGVLISDSDVTFEEIGNGLYVLHYTISEGDQNVVATNLSVNLIPRDAAGNIGSAFAILNSNNISIDANSPVVSEITVSDSVYTVNDKIKINVLADGPAYTFAGETYVNGISISSPRLSGFYDTGNLYYLEYIVGANDLEVEPGNLTVSIKMEDSFGNKGLEFNAVNTNKLAIFTLLPSATIFGNQSICEDDSASLLVYLQGDRYPMNLSINDGTSTIEYSGILDSPFQLKVSPLSTSSYRIFSVVDSAGISNTGNGEAKVFVNLKTPVQITNLNPNYSFDDPPFVLEANPGGGTFFGPGVVSSTSVFSPGAAGTENSPHTIIYSYSNQYGCISKDSVIVSILKASGSLTRTPNKIVYCDYDNDFTVEGENTAGSTGGFRLKNSKGDEVLTGIIDLNNNSAIISPVSLAADNYTIEYDYDDGGATLTLIDNFTIESVSEPRIIVPADKLKNCENEPAFDLEGDIENGVFSGSPGISGDITSGFTFNPATALSGINNILYTQTTQNGCSNSSALEITVYYIPDVNFTVSDICIIGDNKDTTTFVNTTPDTAYYAKWLWAFDDIFSLENTSNSFNGRHSYKDPGNRTVTLIGTTKTACSDTISKTIQFGNKPDGGFTWENDCFVEGDSIKFMNIAVAEDPIVNYNWKFYTSETEFDLISGSSQPYYTFPSISDYAVSLNVVTSIGCENTFYDTVILKDTYKLSDEGSYFISFEEGNGSWSKEGISGPGYSNSWSYGLSNFTGLAPENNSIAWYISPPDISNITEQSYILSPCFDMRGIEKPMLSFDIYRNLLENEGVVLQYTLDNGDTWQNLGDYSASNNEGLNWYNSFRIAGSPGGQKTGWTGFQSGNNWVKTARFASAEIESVAHVQFRFLYGAIHTAGLAHEGFAFDNFRISSRERMVLLEHFTNGSTLSNVREADGHINLRYTDNFNDVIKLEYHTNFPEADAFYNLNKNVQGTRILYYGVDNVPFSIINGGGNGELRFDGESSILGIESNDLILETLYEPEFNINMEVTANSGSMAINVDIISNMDLPAGERLVQVVIYEKKISGINLPNGQNVFLNVVKDMVPNAAGTAFFNAWTKGQTENLQFTWNHKNVYDPAMLRVAVFVQNDDSRKVYQAATNDTTNLNTALGYYSSEELNLVVYPNPANDYIFLSQNKALNNDYDIEIYDQLGRLIIREEWFMHEIVREIDTGDLPGGLYILKVTAKNGKGTGSRRFTIIR